MFEPNAGTGDRRQPTSVSWSIRFGAGSVVVAVLGLVGLLVVHRYPDRERRQPAPRNVEKVDESRGTTLFDRVTKTAVAVPTATKQKPKRSPDEIPDTPAGRAFQAYLHAASGDGTDDADNHALVALERMRAIGEPATALVKETYDALPEDRFVARWMMADTLAELADHGALDDLRDIAAAELPPERLQPEDQVDPHQPTSHGEEVKIRWAALRGVVTLAELGNQEAEQALLDIARNADDAVREKAVVAYVHLGVDRRERKAAVLSTLSEEDRWMAEIPIVDAAKLPPLSPPSEPGVELAAVSDPKPSAPTSGESMSGGPTSGER